MLFLAPKLNADAGFLNACEPFFVYKFSEICLESEHFFAGTAQNELNSIKDVTFAGTVESCYGIELWVKSRDNSAVHVGLEPFEDDLLYVHMWELRQYIC